MPTTVTDVHEEKMTLVIDTFIPGHDPRTTTALFERTRKELIKLSGGVCHFTGMTEEESGHPLEAHHHIIEKCEENGADWQKVKAYIVRTAALWNRALAFTKANPELADINTFVDDMTVNGMLLSKQAHTGPPPCSIHFTPGPICQAQAYLKDGLEFGQGIYIQEPGAAIVVTTTTTTTTVPAATIPEPVGDAPV